MLPSASEVMAQMYADGVVATGLNAGASSSVPSLRMAMPLTVPFSKSSKLDCIQRCVPSAAARTEMNSANEIAHRILRFITMSSLSQIRAVDVAMKVDRGVTWDTAHDNQRRGMPR